MPEADKLVKEWEEELMFAEAARKPYLAHWQYWEEVYDDNLWATADFKKRGRRSKQNQTETFYPQVNELETIVLSILPKIHFYEPVFEIRPVYSDLIWRFSAAVWELYASVLYDILGMHDSIGECALDTLLLGGGVHKTGLWYEVESSEYTLGDETAGGSNIRGEIELLSGDVSPRSLLWDYRVKKWKDKRWLAEEIIKPLDEVKKSPMYKNTTGLVGTLTSTRGIEGVRRKDLRNRKGDLVRLYEIHDFANSQIITIADDHPKVLRKDSDYGEELYDQLTFTPTRPQRVWGKSIVQSIEEHVIRLSKYMYYLDSHMMRGGLSKVLFDPARITKDGQALLENKKDFQLVPVEGLAETAADPVREVKYSNVGYDWFANVNLVQDVIRLLSGVTQQERGRHEAGVETAFEVAKLSEASATRNQDRIKRINKYVSNIMAKVLKLASDSVHPSKILSQVGLPTEWSFMLQGFSKMKLSVKFGSTALEARQQMLSRVAMLGQIAGAAGIPLNPQGYMELVTEALGIEFNEKQLLMGGQAAGTQEAGSVNRPPPAATASSALPAGGVGELGL